MKKRIFTLLMLGFVLSGVFSTVKAQQKLDSIITVSAGLNVEVWATGAAHEGCVDTLKIRFDGVWTATGDSLIFEVSKTLLDYSNIASLFKTNAKGELYYIGTAGTTVTKLLTIATDIPRDVKVQQTFKVRNGGSTIVKEGDLALYTTLRVKIDKFYAPVGVYGGKVELSKTGGSPHIQYSIRGGFDQTWKPWGGNTLVLAEWQVQHLSTVWDIRVVDLDNPCQVDSVTNQLYWNDNPNIIEVPEGSVIAPNLKRPVHIPNGGGAYQTAPGWGVHWVASAKDYTFTVNPLGENRERKLIVSTSDDKYDETIGYLKIDGVWVVTLPVVQKAMNLEISFESAEEPSSSTGSAAVEGTNVWAGSGAIYIAQAQAGSARIYSAAGTLVKTVATPAGETAGVAIAPGFYIVKLNEGNFKVIVK